MMISGTWGVTEPLRTAKFVQLIRQEVTAFWKLNSRSFKKPVLSYAEGVSFVKEEPIIPNNDVTYLPIMFVNEG